MMIPESGLPFSGNLVQCTYVSQDCFFATDAGPRRLRSADTSTLVLSRQSDSHQLGRQSWTSSLDSGAIGRQTPDSQISHVVVSDSRRRHFYWSIGRV